MRTARLGDEVLVPRRGGYSDTPTVAGIWTGIWTADIVALDVDVDGGGARDLLSLRGGADGGGPRRRHPDVGRRQRARANDFLPRVTLSDAELASLLPRYVDLRCDREGTQWIHPFDVDAPGSAFGGLRGGRLWLRTTADGRTDRVGMPDRFDVYRITPGRIWGVQRDELDVATVAWIAVP